eukprot:CAMPEP_0117042486 /NCGR_PEP_ID=MMETSP0472-20121206/29584_1 /TAXON_ID=693140 ORGANISM="Tiarina fusus, Strain LIS" /NCGR_SAMPLE_ID=MMETSP0472 /ASSEMBLY_ACC=CAM_ASM_000603 /LENGTH=242 /DNA_ID=CAMNT_0004753739 /DNA_START=26 /DNA_END=751 /DNA_ORIENTATION=-
MVNAIAPTIVQLNNGALSHFIGRDYEKSIVLLRRAYEVFEAHSRLSSSSDLASPVTAAPAPPAPNGAGISFMQCENDNADSSSPPPHREQEIPRRSAIVDFQMDSLLVKEKTLRSSRVEPTCNYASSPGTAYFMYNRALVFSDQEDDRTLLVTHKHRTAAIILYNLALVHQRLESNILYNLALVHHTIGIQLGVSAALPHAVRLYEMALDSMITGSSTSLLSTPSVLIDVQKLVLALLNNLG